MKRELPLEVKIVSIIFCYIPSFLFLVLGFWDLFSKEEFIFNYSFILWFVFSGVALFLGMGLRKGKKWSRVVGIIFFSIGIAFGFLIAFLVYGVGVDSTPLNYIGGIFSLLSLVALIQLLKKNVKKYMVR